MKKISFLFVLAALSIPSFAAAEMQTPEEAAKALEEQAKKEECLNRIKRYNKDVRKSQFNHTGYEGKKEAPTGVPELDPKGATSGLALLIGGALVLADRRRRSQQ